MAIFNLNFLLKVGQVEMCQNPSPISTLDLVLGLSMVRRCSLNLSFKRRLVSPIYCKLQRLH